MDTLERLQERKEATETAIRSMKQSIEIEKMKKRIGETVWYKVRNEVIGNEILGGELIGYGWDKEDNRLTYIIFTEFKLVGNLRVKSNNCGMCMQYKIYTQKEVMRLR